MPRDPRPLKTLGVLYADLERVDEAVQMLEKATRLAPDDAAALNNLGFLYLCQERYPQARQVLEQAIGLDGTEGRYRNNLAFALVAVGEHHEALRIFRSTGTEGDARYNLGVAFERMGKTPSALLQYEHALRAQPDHGSAAASITRLRADFDVGTDTDALTHDINPAAAEPTVLEEPE